MKKVEKKQKIFTSVLIIIILILMLELVLTKTANMRDNKQIIKEMTEGEYESKITELNASHTDYALQVQENKKKLATAISNQKVTTSEDATIDEMVTNIGKILEAGTSDATATAEDIIVGKTAYVNGELITGITPLQTSTVPSLLSTQSSYYNSEYDNLIVVGYSAIYRSDSGYYVDCSSDKGTVTVLSENAYGHVLQSEPYGSWSRCKVFLITDCKDATITLSGANMLLKAIIGC